VILDTEGNIFGGFTPVEWDSENDSKGDDSVESFLFTLKNPHNIPARRFPLKAEMKNWAICCKSGCCPLFGYGMFNYDLAVMDDCNVNTKNYSYLGNSDNDTELGNSIVLTSSKYFKVQEIEVFEITE
jgi:hypothetical protein